VPSLLALDFELGPELERAIRDAVDSSVAFCVVDRRTSPRRRIEELERLGATAVRDRDGVTQLASGAPVDEEIGLVMLTSGSSGEPKAVELTWAALRASAELTQSTVRGDTAPVWMPCLPACHIGGLAVIFAAVLSDASLHWATVRTRSRGGTRSDARLGGTYPAGPSRRERFFTRCCWVGRARRRHCPRT